MKIVVTGGTGQLGSDLIPRLRADGHETLGPSRQELDLTNGAQLRDYIRQAKPELIVHAAAYTQVDRAEQQPDDAYAVNAYGTRDIAMAASEAGARLIYISTDYVYDGTAQRPYTEFDPCNPLSVYGKSKLAGEQFVRQWVKEHYILRTSWVFGAHGANFVKTMLRLAGGDGPVRVVADQIGSPTYTVDLADFIARLAGRQDGYGTYHVSNAGHCSWHAFCKEIYRQAGLGHIEVEAITTAEFPRPAPRPAYSVMEPMAIRLNELAPLRDWQSALGAFLEEAKRQ